MRIDDGAATSRRLMASYDVASNVCQTLPL
jgi:hypothetical protein